MGVLYDLIHAGSHAMTYFGLFIVQSKPRLQVNGGYINSSWYSNEYITCYVSKYTSDWSIYNYVFTERQADGQTGRWTDRRTERQVDGQIGRRTDIQAGGRTYRWTDRQMGGQAGTRTDRQTDVTFCPPLWLGFLFGCTEPKHWYRSWSSCSAARIDVMYLRNSIRSPQFFTRLTYCVKCINTCDDINSQMYGCTARVVYNGWYFTGLPARVDSHSRHRSRSFVLHHVACFKLFQILLT